MRSILLILGLLLTGSFRAQTQEAKPIYYFNPDWSADGSKLVFESTRDGKFAIYTIQTDGSGLTKLTTGEANDEQPRWSRDGRQIVFISDRDGLTQLYLMDANGENQRRLTRGKEIDFLPELSPKNDLVVFMSQPEKGMAVQDIYVIRIDGSGRRRLSEPNGSNESPRWSPDGKKILFSRTPMEKKFYKDISRQEMMAIRNSGEIYVMNRDGSGIKRLTNNQTKDCCAQWSSDGKTIFFQSTRDGSPTLYAMSADGSNVRKVAGENLNPEPSISRDGRFFAYTKAVNKRWGLYVFDQKSGLERLLIGG
jgi:TolB protein